MATKPISEVVPLEEWIRTYHSFRTELDLRLRETGFNLIELHQNALGPEISPGAWEGNGYRVYVEGRALTFEVSEEASTDEALEAFKSYRESLFNH